MNKGYLPHTPLFRVPVNTIIQSCSTYDIRHISKGKYNLSDLFVVWSCAQSPNVTAISAVQRHLLKRHKNSLTNAIRIMTSLLRTSLHSLVRRLSVAHLPSAAAVSRPNPLRVIAAPHSITNAYTDTNANTYTVHIAHIYYSTNCICACDIVIGIWRSKSRLCSLLRCGGLLAAAGCVVVSQLPSCCAFCVGLFIRTRSAFTSSCVRRLVCCLIFCPTRPYYW